MKRESYLKSRTTRLCLNLSKGLPDQLAFYVRACNPTNPDQAVQFAKAGEAYKYRSQELPIAAAKANAKNKMGDDSSELSEIKQQLADLSSVVSKINIKTQADTNRATRPQPTKNRTPREPVRCYECGELNHFKSDCPKLNTPVRCQLCDQLNHTALQCRLYTQNRNPKKTGVCQICLTQGHTAKECSQFNIGSQTLSDSGNPRDPRDRGHNPSGGQI